MENRGVEGNLFLENDGNPLGFSLSGYQKTGFDGSPFWEGLLGI